MRKRIREREEGDKGLCEVDLQFFHQLLEQRWLITVFSSPVGSLWYRMRKRI
jgi:hypothetical protein